MEAMVDGVRRRSQRARRTYRRGWASLATATLSLPVLDGALEGSISLPTALGRVALAFVLCRLAADLIGSLVEHYQTSAAVAAVTGAIADARAAADSDDEESAGGPEAHG